MAGGAESSPDEPESPEPEPADRYMWCVCRALYELSETADSPNTGPLALAYLHHLTSAEVTFEQFQEQPLDLLGLVAAAISAQQRPDSVIQRDVCDDVMEVLAERLQYEPRYYSGDSSGSDEEADPACASEVSCGIATTARELLDHVRKHCHPHCTCLCHCRTSGRAWQMINHARKVTVTTAAAVTTMKTSHALARCV